MQCVDHAYLDNPGASALPLLGAGDAVLTKTGAAAIRYGRIVGAYQDKPGAATVSAPSE